MTADFGLHLLYCPAIRQFVKYIFMHRTPLQYSVTGKHLLKIRY